MISCKDLHTPRPINEWDEDIGDVLWWAFPIEEGPYVGTPLDLGQSVSVCIYNAMGKQIGETTVKVGGWPGYHTHWTPLPDPKSIEINSGFVREAP